MSVRDLPRWLLPAILGAAALVVILVIVLGGGDDDAAEGPAGIVPESAPVYMDFSLRPEGEAKESAEAALGAILDTSDPGAEIVSLVEQEAREEGEDFDYEEDIAPWLGERFAVYLTAVGSDDKSQGGFIIETSDPDRALEFIREQEDEEPEEEKEYEGVDYTIDSDGDAFGVIDDFLVGGDESSFKAAVDAADGDSLGEADEFEDSIDELSSDRLATLYVPVQKFLDAIAEEELGSQEREFVEKALGEAAEEPVLGQVTASATDVSLELSAGGGAETEQSTLLESLPADAWLGIGFGDVGAAIDQGVDSIDDAGVDSETISAQVKAQLGVELDALTAALGEAAIFVSGTTVADLGGALIIQDKDTTVTANLLDRLQTIIARQSQGTVRVQPLPGPEAGFQVVDPSGEVPKPVQVVQSNGKIIVGYGADFARQASRIAQAPNTVAESPAFEGAQEAVGDLGLDLFLAFEPVFALAESEGASADPDYRQAKAYLESLAFLAVGSGSDGDRSTVRLIVGLD